MKSFAIVALLAATQAITCEPACGCNAGYGGNQGNQDYRIQGLNKQVNLPCGGGIGSLVSIQAGSTTQIGAQNIVVPDKKTITDQAKVSKTQAQSKKQDQGCGVSKRSFSVKGGIKITQKGENTSKGESSAKQCGEDASQSKESESVKSNNCAQASLPTTEGQVDYDQSCGCQQNTCQTC